jgi:lipid-binding SYLF domain-containing protein
MHTIRLAVLAAFVLSTGLVTTAWGQITPATSSPATDEAKLINDSIEVLQELTGGPDRQIPEHLLARAEAIVVIPSLIKGGFIVGAKHGKGIVSTFDRTANTWSNPAFVNMTGGSIGWQIGVEAVDLVLLVMNRNGVDELLEDRFTLGGNLSISAGPVGRTGAAATDAQFSAQILAYSRSKGLFAGATLEGAALHSDNDSNEALYNQESLRDVLKATPGPSAPAAAGTWRSTMKRLVTAEPNP